MAFQLFQGVVVLVAVFMILKSYEKYKLRIFRDWEFYSWSLLWSIVVVLSLFPDLLNTDTQSFLIFRRPIDALFFMAILVSFLGLNLIFGLFEQQRRDITELTRNVAILAEKLDAPGSEK